MGQQLKDLVRAASEHHKTKEVEEKISQAVKQIGEEIDRVVARARASEEGARVKAAGEELVKTAQKWKETGAKEEIERGMAKSVRALNEQIRRAVDEIKKGTPSQEE